MIPTPDATPNEKSEVREPTQDEIKAAIDHGYTQARTGGSAHNIPDAYMWSKKLIKTYQKAFWQCEAQRERDRED
jgi:hypothetical protein